MRSKTIPLGRVVLLCGVSCVLLLNGFSVSAQSVTAQSVSAQSVTAQSNSKQGADSATAKVLFKEVEGVIPLEERSRRKWDNAVVADLDQDGFQDLLLTEHSHRLRLFWNNEGTFSQPEDIYHGDSHGVAVGDYDQDGRMDLIVALGGGDGTKPSNPIVYQINRDRQVDGGEELTGFERTRGRAAKLLDIDQNGSLDLVTTGFPLKTQTDGANDLYRNTGTGTFEFVSKLPFAQWMGFRALVTDFNNDDISDIIFYGGKDMVLVQGAPGGGFTDVSENVLGIATDTTFVSSISEIDFDNDGDFDLFITRADHPFDVELFFDQENSRFAFFSRFKEFKFEDLTIDGDFKLENLQMAYPDFDVFVGADKRKLEFDIDRHGHNDLVLKPEEAAGWPESLEEKGLYIGHLGDGVWRIAGDTKSPTAGVVHKVISRPQPSARDPLPAIMLENVDGHFENVTMPIGISIDEQTTSAAVGDFDNDGWSDLFVVRYGNPASSTEQIVYLNQQGKWFERVQDHGVVSHELGSTGGGADAFDYDNDGDLDLVYGNERGRWHVVTNQGLTSDTNNYLIIKVGDSPSGKATAMGATLTLKAGENTYRRVVGQTSAAFCHSANNQLHVGLGNCEKVDQAEVRWTNGETETLKIDGLNQTVTAGRFK